MLMRLPTLYQRPEPFWLLFVSRQRTVLFSANLYSHVHCLNWTVQRPRISCSSSMGDLRRSGTGSKDDQHSAHSRSQIIPRAAAGLAGDGPGEKGALAFA